MSSRRAWRRLSAVALSVVASAAYAYPAWQPDTFYAAGPIVTYNGTDYTARVNQTDYGTTGLTPTLASLWQSIGTSGGGAGGACATAWTATNVYTGGSAASVGAVNYTANYWTQGVDPSIHNGGAGGGEPWTSSGNCSGGATNPSTNPTLGGN